METKNDIEDAYASNKINNLYYIYFRKNFQNVNNNGAISLLFIFISIETWAPILNGFNYTLAKT
jgi:hypothetical protein